MGCGGTDMARVRMPQARRDGARSCIVALVRSANPGQPRSHPARPFSPTRATPERRTDPSAIGTILSTIGIAVAASGGGDKAAASTSAPPPVKEDASINTGNSEEDEL